MENVSFQTKLDLFSNYIENPQNIDVFWETLLSMKVNEFLSASLGTTLIYDDDIQINTGEVNDLGQPIVGPRVQFKQLFNLGITYNF